MNRGMAIRGLVSAWTLAPLSGFCPRQGLRTDYGASMGISISSLGWINCGVFDEVGLIWSDPEMDGMFFPSCSCGRPQSI